MLGYDKIKVEAEGCMVDKGPDRCSMAQNLLRKVLVGSLRLAHPSTGLLLKGRPQATVFSQGADFVEWF